MPQSKKKFSVYPLLFLLLIIFLVPGSVAAQSLGSRSLSAGSTGDDVLALQNLLKIAGYDPGAANGIFGAKTRSAVIAFQKAAGITSNGFVGPQTLKILSTYQNSTVHRVRRGDSLYIVAKKSTPAKPVREVLGFYTEDEPGLPGSWSSVQNNAGQITTVAPFYYRLSKENDGTLELMPDIDEVTARKTIAEAHQKQIKVLALVHNMLYGDNQTSKKLTRSIMCNPEAQKRFADNLLQVLRKNNYDGVNIDIENIYEEDKDLYTALIGRVSQVIKAEGYQLTVSLPAKTGAVTTDNSWSEFYDYQAVGQLADQVVIMTYDEHGAYGTPGPIASIDWVEKSIQYVLTQMPSEKVMLGIAAYGFDWPTGNSSGDYFNFTKAMETAKLNNAPVKWDAQAQVPYYTYQSSSGVQHQVWFENKDSLIHKLDLVNKYNLRGIGIWRLGMEDPGYWPVINDKFIIKK
ncbi:MAG: glycosyl hydrolase family 18 protein [Bacillota bacterium]